MKRHYSEEETHPLTRLLLLINRVVPATPYNAISNVSNLQPTQAVLRCVRVLAHPPGRLGLGVQLNVSAATKAAAAYHTGSSLLYMSGECDGEQGKRTGAGAG